MKTKQYDRYFFSGVAIWFLILTVYGFYPSFYKPGASTEMPIHLILHGVVFSSWIILFLVQALLINYKNYKLHMTLGWFAIVLCIAIFLTGSYTSFMKKPMILREVGDNLTYVTTFTIFFISALINRKKAHVHKRLMVFGTIILTSAAAARVVIFGIDFGKSALLYYGLMFFPAMCLFAYDFLVKRKIYKINILCFLVIIVLLLFTNYIWETIFWANFVDKIINILS